MKKIKQEDLGVVGSQDIADMVLEAAAEVEEELVDIYRDILNQGKKPRRKKEMSNANR